MEHKKNKKINYLMMGALISGLIIMGLTIQGCSFKEKPILSDLPPMIYVNNTLFIQSEANLFYESKVDTYIFLGRIQSRVDSNKQPKKNFQANDDIIGSEVYKCGEEILVLIDGKYWVYRPDQ